MRELGTQQVTDGDQIAVGAIATGARLGRLDQAVHGLDEAIGQAGPITRWAMCSATPTEKVT